MIEEGDPIENSLLTNDEIAVKSMRLGLKWHYPARIRIQQILDESFKCDWKRRHIITELIVYYGLGQYVDSDQSDLLINKESADALKTNDPIAYIKRIKQQQTRPTIKATNAIVGDNNTGNNQGRDFGGLPKTQPVANPSQNTGKNKNNDVNISKAQFIFWLFTTFTTGAAFAIALSNFLKK